jgi:hypothetical protein
MAIPSLDEYQNARRELDHSWEAHKAFMDRLSFYLDRVIGVQPPYSGEVSSIVLWQEFESVDRGLQRAQARLARATVRLLMDTHVAD